jgi:hypothetical protein
MRKRPWQELTGDEWKKLLVLKVSSNGRVQVFVLNVSGYSRLVDSTVHSGRVDASGRPGST